jgi:hypothetical protein
VFDSTTENSKLGNPNERWLVFGCKNDRLLPSAKDFKTVLGQNFLGATLSFAQKKSQHKLNTFFLFSSIHSAGLSQTMMSALVLLAALQWLRVALSVAVPVEQKLNFLMLGDWGKGTLTCDSSFFSTEKCTKPFLAARVTV